MSEPRELVFQCSADLAGSLPESCSVAVSCYEAPGIRHLVATRLQNTLQSLAGSGMDLRALDGVTLTEDCAAASMLIQKVPEGHVPLQMGEQPHTLEMARTVPVWRNDELRFHIVLRAGLGIGLLSKDKTFQTLAYACIAHEAAHVEHEGHLYRTFPDIYGIPIPCGDRSRNTFLKALDVWSEYAACRSSATFRPEAVEEFEKVFCRALDDGLSVSGRCIADSESGADATERLKDILQFFGDVFVYAGYFLGHLDGLRLDLEQHAPSAWSVLAEYPEVGAVVRRLHSNLQELWLHEFEWHSIEVFAPIYDVICSIMALHCFVLTKDELDWKIQLCRRGMG